MTFAESGLTEAQVDAMDAIFAFDAAIHSGNLSALDLLQVLRIAVDGGKDNTNMLAIEVHMLAVAIDLLAQERGDKVRISSELISEGRRF